MQDASLGAARELRRDGRGRAAQASVGTAGCAAAGWRSGALGVRGGGGGAGAAGQQGAAGCLCVAHFLRGGHAAALFYHIRNPGKLDAGNAGLWAQW